MEKSTKFKCPHCEEEYWIKWESEIEPDTCPFCGGASGIDEDNGDAIFKDELVNDEDNDWN